MKAKITAHEIREVDWNIILYMQYHYKWVDSTVSVIDLPKIPNTKLIKAYKKTAEKAINEELRKKEDNENEFKKEMKKKQKELDEMRKFVKTRWHDQESIKSALQEFKKLQWKQK